jgi:hypothetical protein
VFIGPEFLVIVAMTPAALRQGVAQRISRRAVPLRIVEAKKMAHIFHWEFTFETRRKQ